MPLHPDLEAFLELANPNPRQMSEMTFAEARQRYEQSTLALDLPGPNVPIDSLEAPCRDGSRLAARLYRGPQTDGPQPCAVLAVDYRLAPEHKFPTAFEDAHVTRLWQEQGDLSKHRDYLQRITENPRALGLIGCPNSTPFAYFGWACCCANASSRMPSGYRNRTFPQRIRSRFVPSKEHSCKHTI